jgi:hypothetical protein
MNRKVANLPKIQCILNLFTDGVLIYSCGFNMFCHIIVAVYVHYRQPLQRRLCIAVIDE